jgi:pimeloyl-ACP methyl ester carboxylesterase
MERMIAAGNREEALLLFLRDIVKISPEGIAAMKGRSSWPDRVATVDIQIREIRALSKYRFDAARVKKLAIPTLLLTGSNTASRQLKQAINTLMDTLPNRRLITFEGEEHNAMDTIPQHFAETVTRFLLPESKN